MCARQATVLCIAKERLIREYAQAVADCDRLLKAQVESLYRGGDLYPEVEFTAAAQRREDAKYSLIAHQEQHGC